MLASDALRAGIMGVLVLVALDGLPVALIPALAAAATMAGVVYPPSVAPRSPRAWWTPIISLPPTRRAEAIAPACVSLPAPRWAAVLLLIGPTGGRVRRQRRHLRHLRSAHRLDPRRPGVLPRAPVPAGGVRDALTEG